MTAASAAELTRDHGKFGEDLRHFMETSHNYKFRAAGGCGG
jgi:hypothetical protein